MCAIFGWIKNNQDLNQQEIGLAGRALRSMKHRGPDATGDFARKNIYLGHNRLSIIDLDAHANQPFWSDDKRYVIIFNGEVYNYVELREALEKEGVSFRTRSDTEVVLKAFIHYGVDALLKFDGMFAFALHDCQGQKTYVVRDFLGQKPLYYFQNDADFIFASELKAFLQIDSFVWKLDKRSFYKYLMNTCYMGATSPIEGVHKLLPGHYLLIEGNGEVTTHQYWDSIPGQNTLDITWDEAVKQFETLFDHSCKITMRSDVPYGVFLSGGIDSSLVLASCLKSNPDISSFVVSIQEDDFDESYKADSVIKHLGIQSAHTYKICSESIHDHIEEHFAALDEPHGDPGYVSSFFLTKSCRKEITVGLAGDGADELLAGYIPFKALSKIKWFDKWTPGMISFFRKAAKALVPSNDKYMGLQFLLLFFLKGFPSARTIRLPLWLSAMSPEELSRLCPKEDKKFFSRYGEPGTLYEDSKKRLKPVENSSNTDMALYYYQKFFLPSYVYMHTDRAAMWHSLEVRSPFLSVPLIEFCNRLPSRFKTSRGKLKYLLRRYAKDKGFAPEVYRQKKQGFSIPISRWLMTTLKENMKEALGEDKRFNALIDRAYLNELIEEHFAGKCNNYPILFNLMVFSKWLEKNPSVVIEGV